MDRLRQLAKDDFFRYNIAFFIGSIAVGFLNYLYHPILSRLMSVESFGEVQAIFSLSLQIGIVTNVLGMVALNIISHKEKEPNREKVLGDLQTIAGYFALLVALTLLILSSKLSTSLQFASPLPFVLLAGVLITNVIYVFRKFYLQAHHDFKGVSIGGALVAGGRVLFAAILVAVGFGTAGAVGAVIVAQIVALFYVTKRIGFTTALSFKWMPSLNGDVRKELYYGLLTLFAFGFIVFITSADVVFAKYYFAPETAGVYSGISAIARVIYFATASVAGVLLPAIKRWHPFHQNVATLSKALLLLGVMGGAALLFIFIFPTFITLAVVGAKFGEFAPLLPRLALVSFLGALINILFFYFLALRMYALIPIALLGATTTVFSVLSNHNTPVDIINGFLYGALVAIAGLAVLFFAQWRSRRVPEGTYPIHV